MNKKSLWSVFLIFIVSSVFSNSEILVFDFIQWGGEAQESALGKVFTEYLSYELNLSKEVVVQPRKRKMGRLADIDYLPEGLSIKESRLFLCRALSIPFYVDGHYSLIGDQLSVSISCIEVFSEKSLWNKEFSMELSQLPGVMAEAGLGILAALTLNPASETEYRAKIKRVQTPKVLELFALALDAYDDFDNNQACQIILDAESLITEDPVIQAFAKVVLSHNTVIPMTRNSLGPGISAPSLCLLYRPLAYGHYSNSVYVDTRGYSPEDQGITYDDSYVDLRVGGAYPVLSNLVIGGETAFHLQENKLQATQEFDYYGEQHTSLFFRNELSGARLSLGWKILPFLGVGVAQSLLQLSYGDRMVQDAPVVYFGTELGVILMWDQGMSYLELLFKSSNTQVLYFDLLQYAPFSRGLPWDFQFTLCQELLEQQLFLLNQTSFDFYLFNLYSWVLNSSLFVEYTLFDFLALKLGGNYSYVNTPQGYHHNGGYLLGLKANFEAFCVEAALETQYRPSGFILNFGEMIYDLQIGLWYQF